MHLRLAVGVALAVALAGCGSVPSVRPADTTATPTTDAPELTPKPLPERPDELTRESVRSFAEAYERAYKWNRELTADTVDMTVNPVRVRVTNVTEDGFVVHLEVGFSHTLRSDGAKMVGDGFYTVNYFVNATAVMRAETGGQARPGPDPRNGTVIG